MFRTTKSFLAFLLIFPLMAVVNSAQDYSDDGDSEEPTARVARVSYLKGEAQIKRIENEEWETVVDNLPLVEGDTIQTDRKSRLEIQLDRYSFIRLDEDSTLKFTFLADEGIAVSLSRGTVGLTLIRFDKDKSYLEVDAPDSTVAIQKSGVYRIDAGNEYNREVRVSVRDDGEARVYSRDSGFTLKDGKSARLFLDGTMAGEWETSRASNLNDAFDSWMRDQDERIAENLADRDVQYYDEDVYGADSLSDNGEWVYTSDYGHIWRPYSSAIAGYSDWSPYRYGQWRWLPYYGWTWVNDEPWGWATYHHGRWIFYRGRWYWTPYRHYRSYRSWRPAIVFVTYIGNNFCWYPLPWGYNYYDYNYRFRDYWPRRQGYGRGHYSGNNDNGNPVPFVPQANIDRANRLRTPPLSSVPPTGVVTVDSGEFGRTTKGFRRPTLGVARQVLDQKPVMNESPPILPNRDDLDGKLGKEILVAAPNRSTATVKTGAGTRRTVAPLDDTLRQEKIYGNRTPRTQPMIIPGPPPAGENPRTGVFDRSKRPESESKQKDSGTVYTPPVRSEPETKRQPRPTYSPEQKQPEQRPSPPTERKYEPRPSPPRNNPSPAPPTKRDPPPRRTPEPRPAPPTRQQPAPDPPTTKSPPPTRAPEQRAPEQKPQPSKPSPKGKPDNR